ncbi:MAG: thioredoxin family protein [Planctomycetota bacterium]|nr:thioredoxin family protein [Planctomycetota bacterium]
MNRILTILFAGAVLGTALAAEMPEFSGEWAQDGPYTRDSLQGKVTVLYFYEEGCPRCRGRWPDLEQVRLQFEKDPVLFVAVNSGNDKRTVESYAKSVNSHWAFFVDQDRSFEKQALRSEISLQNIYQAMILDPSGNLGMANPSNLADGIKARLNGAKWRIDPAEVPEPLTKAWRAFEFGRMAEAAPAIRQAQASSDAKTKAVAQKMADEIKALIAKRIEDAKTKVAAGDTWAGYKLYDGAASAFKDFPEARPAAAEAGKLRNDAKVKKELQARFMLEKAREMLASGKDSVRQQGRMGLEAIQAQFPDTEAAAAAKALK